MSILRANTWTGPWDTVALKHVVLSIQTGPFGSQLHAEEYSSGGRPVINPAHLRDGHIEPDSDCAVDDDTFGRLSQHELREGDVVIGRRGELGRCGVVTRDQAGWLCGTGSIRVRPDARKLHSSWLRWLLAWAGSRDWLTLESVGSTMDNLGAETVGSMPISIPPLRLQRLIADHLNHETARLDGLVSAKERVLGLVTEKQRALITRAVTRGLDPRAPLRDSGVPWLGEIPAHWTATRMKFLATEPLAYGANEAALEDDPTFPRFVRITDIDSEGNLRDETFKSLPPEGAEPYLLRDGDVLLARSGATVGKAFIYKPAWGIACFAGYLIRCRCNTVLMQPDFLFAYTQTEPYWWQVREGTIQATIQNFSAEKYGDLVVTVPSLEEQKAIIAHITTETAKLDALRAATERTIALLKERRAALIAAAVTGKLDVQEAGSHINAVAD